MAYEVGAFDPQERIKEKQVARERDDLLLRRGQISPEQLRQQNSFVGGFDVQNAVIQRRSVRVAA